MLGLQIPQQGENTSELYQLLHHLSLASTLGQLISTILVMIVTTPQSHHRQAAGGRRGVRTPSHTRPSATDRIPGIVALENRDGKHSDSKIPTVVDWARNCPVAYAEKIKYDELNLPMWVWAFVSEILSSRTGMSPALPTGELEARLQHLLCVLQVTLVNSEKIDFNSKGWTMASVYFSDLGAF